MRGSKSTIAIDGHTHAYARSIAHDQMYPCRWKRANTRSTGTDRHARTQHTQTERQADNSTHVSDASYIDLVLVLLTYTDTYTCRQHTNMHMSYVHTYTYIKHRCLAPHSGLLVQQSHNSHVARTQTCTPSSHNIHISSPSIMYPYSYTHAQSMDATCHTHRSHVASHVYVYWHNMQPTRWM